MHYRGRTGGVSSTFSHTHVVRTGHICSQSPVTQLLLFHTIHTTPIRTVCTKTPSNSYTPPVAHSSRIITPSHDT